MTLRMPHGSKLIALALLGMICVGALAGCSGTDSSAVQEAPTPAAGGMGMAESAEGDAPMGSMVVAAARNAFLEVAADGAPDVTADTLEVARVNAPADGWLVVRSATAPGGVLGATRVPRGESRDVAVCVCNPDAVGMRVALHVDRGTKGALEFDPTGVRRMPDSPVYVSGRPVEAAVAVPEMGAAAVANAALIQAEDQRAQGRSITISYLLLPEPSWIAVSSVGEDGLADRQLALVNRAAGEWHLLNVTLAEVPRGELVVTALADRGQPGQFDYSAKEPFSSPDRPFVSAGVAVAQRIAVE